MAGRTAASAAATGGGNYAGFYAIAVLLVVSAGITLSLKFAKKDEEVAGQVALKT